MTGDARPLVFEVVVEAADVLAAEGALRRLQQARTRAVVGRQNEIRFVGRRVAFRVLQVLAPLGWFLGVVVVVERIRADAPFDEVLPWGLLAFALFLLSAFVLFAGSDLADELMFRLTDRLWASSARSTAQLTAKHAPFTATYSCSDEEWVTRIDEPKKEVRLRRGDPLEVSCEGDVCLVYRGRLAQRFGAIVWAKTPEVREALLRFVDTPE